MQRLALLICFVTAPTLTFAQGGAVDHSTMHAQHTRAMTSDGDTSRFHENDMAGQRNQPTMPAGVTKNGQSAFAAIQEIVNLLMSDPDTDWSQVDIDALRAHLIDMDNITLRANVMKHEIEGGARFDITSESRGVVASIRTMVPAHVATMDGAGGWSMTSERIDGGASLSVAGVDEQRIRALGFAGIMTVGMHHQTHHLAVASGDDPHAH